MLQGFPPLPTWVYIFIAIILTIIGREGITALLRWWLDRKKLPAETQKIQSDSRLVNGQAAESYARADQIREQVNAVTMDNLGKAINTLGAQLGTATERIYNLEQGKMHAEDAIRERDALINKLEAQVKVADEQLEELHCKLKNKHIKIADL